MGAATQPIRDLNTVLRITQEMSRLKDTPRGRRAFLLWIVGVHMGMRISDIVDLKVGDLRKDYYTYLPHKQEGKRGARRITIPVPAEVRKVIRFRCNGMQDDDWLLSSKKKKATVKADPSKAPKYRERCVHPGAIGRNTAREDLRWAFNMCGFADMPVSCHTMRKTFGYHYYKKTKDLAKLQEWFYHESPATTLIYIGIQAEEFQKMVNDSPFGDMNGVDL